MDYIGEHLFPGQLGQFFIVLSLVSSIVASFAYFKYSRMAGLPDGFYWRRLARAAFIIETISIVAIFSILFYIIYNHLFEYKYAWQHSSRSLELKYLLACFWEGQEGSFMLWSFWHCVLGLVVMRSARNWEGPVMTVISFGQVILATMIAGLYVMGSKIGSNPFMLLRDSGVFDTVARMHVDFNIAAPIRSDYLASVTDGNDLNPLLQNYWMVIHPPVLFLGFASTIVPFSFAVAGLWTKKFGDWIRHVLPWSLFSLAILGVGIMMGAKWAYESLTFGGYWAWDPVENASLVPWLIMAAGVHTVLIYKHSGHSLRSSYLFIILSFFFVLYSTFLTRSGILGETSVHAFTDLGMNNQLYLLLYLFIWPVALIAAKTDTQKISTATIAVFLLVLTRVCVSLDIEIAGKPIGPILALLSLFAGLGALIYQIQTQVPGVAKEESTSSREFWMFIGSLVFFLSAIVIIAKTSLPVLNKIWNVKRAAPENAEYSYNQVQIMIAIIIAVLTAVTQYLRYKETPARHFLRKIAWPSIISLVAGSLIVIYGNINYDKEGAGFLAMIWIAVVCSVYAIVANLSYIWIGLRGKFKLSGGSISHFGFGMVLLGILLSSSKKEILSYNTSGIPIDFGKGSEEKTGENLTLVKGMPMKMGKFDVTYVSDSAHPKKQQWYFNIHFKSRTDKEEFTLQPDAFINYKGNEGLMANPSSRHYLGHDIFTYISALPNPEKNRDTASFMSHTVNVGDSTFYSRGFIVLEALEPHDSLPIEGFLPGDKATVAKLRIHSTNRTSYAAETVLVEKKGVLTSLPDTIMAESMVIRLDGITAGGAAQIGVKESSSILQYVTLKAYKFPGINIFWIGVLITATGIIMSMVRRIRLNRLSAKS